MKKFILPALLLISLASCRKDIDLTADYKEIPIVYCLLDPADSIQYVRVSKAFLGDGDAFVMAEQLDSTQYGDEMEVYLERYEWGTLKKTYTLTDTIIYDKEGGLFPYPAQKLYVLYTHPSGPDKINPDFEYRLIAKNTLTGIEASARIKIVKPFVVSKPNFLTSSVFSVNFAKPNAQDPNVWDFITPEAKWKEAENGRIYEFKARFYFNEEDAVTHVVRDTCLDWNLGTFKGTSLSGGGDLLCDISGQNFYTWLASRLDTSLNVIRHLGKSADPDHHFDFIITVGGDEIATYIEVNEPSTGILIEKPEYTNIINGYGIFSCRYNRLMARRKFDLNSQDYLKTGSLTQGLHFQ